MKNYLVLAVIAFVCAGLLSNTLKPAPPKVLSTDCYVSCYTSETRAVYRQEAGTLQFAKMHKDPLPFVLEDGTGKTISFSTADGTNGMAYEIMPKKKTQNYLLVIHEWYGLNDYIKQEAETLAKDLAGNMNVLALDLYDGKVAQGADSAMKYVQAVKNERLENIINGAIAYAGPNANIFTIGWCFGGMWSLQASILAGKQLKGGVMYYGRPENNVDKLSLINADIIGFFGNKDRSPSPEIVNAFEKNMADAGRTLIVNKYDAGHGFANPSNPSFNKAAKEDAYAKTLAFLKMRM